MQRLRRTEATMQNVRSSQTSRDMVSTDLATGIRVSFDLDTSILSRAAETKKRAKVEG